MAPHPHAAQLSSLATLPPADRQLREPTLLSKRATVEAWLTREANTLQKYRLVNANSPRIPTAFLCSLLRWTAPYCVKLGPSRETPENSAAVEEAANHHSGRWADPVEETATAGRQRGPARGRPGHPAVMVCCLPPPTKITAANLPH